MPKRRWTATEIEKLVQRYPEEGPNLLALDLCRSQGSIDSQASRLQMRSINRRVRQWLTRRQRKNPSVCDKTAISPRALKPGPKKVDLN